MFYKIIQIVKALSIKERYIFWPVASIFALSAIVLVFSLYYQKTEPKPVAGGSYTEGIIGQPVSINPLIAGDNETDRDLINLTFAGLLDLTEKYSSDSVQKVWTLYLKPDLKWSDGEPLTADDVLFTIGVVQDPDARSPFFATWQGVVAERISEREVKLILKNTYAFFLDNIEHLKIAPKHIFDNIPPQNFRLSEYNLQPVGSGPYKFNGFDKRPDGFITEYFLVTNKFYSDKNPYIKNFSLRFFPNKEEALASFNIRGIDGLAGLEKEDLSKLKVSHKIIEASRPRYYSVFLNPSTNLALKEKDVRLALNLATDRAKLIESALGGEAEVEFGPIPSSVTGYDASIYTNELFSSEKAGEILDKAGWKLTEAGIREKMIQKNKLSLSFDLVVPDAKFLSDVANSLKEDWAKIGVKINPILLKPADIISAVIKPRNYQMVIFGNTLNSNPDVFSFWHSSQRFDPGLNLSLFSDKTVDSLLESIRQNLDETSRATDISKLQKVINDAKPAVFLFSPKYLYATSQSLGGFSADSIAAPADRFERVNDWYLKTARVFK